MAKVKRLKHKAGDKAGDPRTDWERVDAMSDEEVEAAAKSDPDNPPLTEEDFKRLKPRRPKSANREPE